MSFDVQDETTTTPQVQPALQPPGVRGRAGLADPRQVRALRRAVRTGPAVVTSYHPNARGTWARTAVADRLFEFFDRHGVALA
jgi:hypothetical protein